MVTEAGFGADLGAEKFLDIKCRFAGLKPDAAVLVATIRALKMNGGKAKNELTESDPEAVKRGLPNLLRHISNLKKYGLIAAMVLLYLLAVVLVPQLFHLCPLGYGGWLLLVVFLLLMPSVLFALSKLDYAVQQWVETLRRTARFAKNEIRQSHHREHE